MPPEEERLQEANITATLGIALSPNLQGKYKVEIVNLETVLEPISIVATPEARRAYEQQPYPPMTLFILDEDAKTTEVQRRIVKYNLPMEFVRQDQIRLNQQPVEARFRLIPLPLPEPETQP
jgi:hypothetical protein